jgi:GT2 family glycosyltransferase
MPDVSIVIVSYNTKDITCQCLRSILDRTAGVTFEIIVVDNGSEDGSVDQIRTEFPTVRLIESPDNLGFAAGQNLGILRSQGDFVLILNSDIIILDDAISTLVEALREPGHTWGMVGPRVQQLDGSLAPSARREHLGTTMQALGVVNRYFKFRRFLPETAMRAVAGRLLGKFHDNYRPHVSREEVGYVDGMAAMVRREALEKAGLFDEQYFFDYEIIDLANRIRSAGWTIAFIPEAQVIHIGHVSRKKVSRILVETIRSELTFFAKYYPARFPLIRRLNLLFARAKVAYFKNTGKPEERAAEIEIFSKILGVCQDFDPVQATRTDRIPALPARAQRGLQP